MNAQPESMTHGTSVSTDSISDQLFCGFADQEYRRAYAEEQLNTFVALQIRAIREQREWTQEELGERCGKKQGWISTIEDPNYGKFTLTTLKQVASAFDCILEVRFRSFKGYSDDQERRRQGDLRVNTYAEDVAELNLESKLRDSLAFELKRAVEGFTEATPMESSRIAVANWLKQANSINWQQTEFGFMWPRPATSNFGASSGKSNPLNKPRQTVESSGARYQIAS